MNCWSNIEISTEDSEIIEINNFEETLGDLPENVLKVRELIRRFEVCHFKYKEHLEHIKDSIRSLTPNIDPTNIGAYHISKGRDALKNDKTGRSIVGQQYLDSLIDWLGDCPKENSEYINDELNQQVAKWLRGKSQDKERIVRLLIARLMWDWKSYEKYHQEVEHKSLKLQVCRMDICHYAFAKHLDLLIQGIGRMKPVDNFEGCGTFNADIKTYVKDQFSILCDYIKSKTNKNNLEKNEPTRIWLAASLAKTLKEQTGLKSSLPQLNKY